MKVAIENAFIEIPCTKHTWLKLTLERLALMAVTGKTYIDKINKKRSTCVLFTINQAFMPRDYVFFPE